MRGFHNCFGFLAESNMVFQGFRLRGDRGSECFANSAQAFTELWGLLQGSEYFARISP